MRRLAGFTASYLVNNIRTRTGSCPHRSSAAVPSQRAQRKFRSAPSSCYCCCNTPYASPKLIQQPNPTVWIGARVPATLESAGRLGNAVVMSPSWPLLELAAAADIYRKAALAAGNDPEIVMIRDAWAADSLEDAARVFGPQSDGRVQILLVERRQRLSRILAVRRFPVRAHLEGPHHYRCARDLRHRI